MPPQQNKPVGFIPSWNLIFCWSILFVDPQFISQIVGDCTSNCCSCLFRSASKRSWPLCSINLGVLSLFRDDSNDTWIIMIICDNMSIAWELLIWMWYRIMIVLFSPYHRLSQTVGWFVPSPPGKKWWSSQAEISFVVLSVKHACVRCCKHCWSSTCLTTSHICGICISIPIHGWLGQHRMFSGYRWVNQPWVWWLQHTRTLGIYYSH